MTSSERFHGLYVTSSAVAAELQVTRTAIAQARADGRLPDSIPVEGGRFYLWERATIEPYIQAWKERLTQKRGNT